MSSYNIPTLYGCGGSRDCMILMPPTLTIFPYVANFMGGALGVSESCGSQPHCHGAKVMARCGYLSHIIILGSGLVSPEKSRQCGRSQSHKPIMMSRGSWILPQDFAATAVLLSNLMRKNAPVKVQWMQECDRAFKAEAADVHRSSAADS